MKTIDALSQADEQLIFSYLTDTLNKGVKPCRAHRNIAIILLMLDAGLRVGEVVRLLVSDLIYNLIPVKSILITLEIAEKGCTREIPVTARLYNALEKCNMYLWLPITRNSNPHAFFAYDPDEPLSIRTIQMFVDDAGISALGRRLNPHVFRHTFATKLMRVTSIRTVQKLLGHKKLTSTQIYTHPNNQDLKSAITGLENADLTGNCG